MSDSLNGIIDGTRAAREAFMAAFTEEVAWLDIPAYDETIGAFSARSNTTATYLVDAVTRACNVVATEASEQVFYETKSLGRARFHIATFSRSYDTLDIWRIGPNLVEHWMVELRVAYISVIFGFLQPLVEPHEA